MSGFIDTSTWKADHPGWAFKKNDATYALTSGDSSSRLSSPIMPIGENRTISLSAEILGGFGMLYVRGWSPEGIPWVTKNEGGTGVVCVTLHLDERFDRYELIMSAWPGVSKVPGEVIDPSTQVITFRNVSYGEVPTYGEVAVPKPTLLLEPILEPIPAPEPIIDRVPVEDSESVLRRIVAMFRF